MSRSTTRPRLNLRSFRALPAILVLLGLGSGALATAREPRPDRFEARSPLPLALFQAREGKHVACFLTINSTEEKQVFTKYLDPAQWDLVELTSSSDTGRGGWFERACHSGVKCDVDVISGHFAGQFFGQSGFTLGLSDLENHSCAEDCNGVLKNPREVFLFGCNTLAGKGHDSRTPEEYYNVLRKDGYSPEAATRVVQDRYGPFGQDNQGKMRRSFSGVPYIYGYNSISPLGKTNEPMLIDYLGKLGDYTKHIDAIATSGKTAATAPNLELKQSMDGTAFTQCAGLDPGDSSYALHLQICKLFNPRLPISDRLLEAERLMNSADVLAVLPSLQNFVYYYIRSIKQDAPDLFKRLQSNANARKILLDTIAMVKPSITQIGWTRFAYVMNWYTRDQFVGSVHGLVDAAFADANFQPDMADAICSLDIRDLDRQDFSAVVPKLTAAHFRSVAAAAAMSCIGLPRYPEFRAKLRDAYAGRAANTAADAAILSRIFAYADPTSPNPIDLELLGKLKEACTAANNYYCVRALALLGSGDLDTTRLLVERYRRASPDAQMDDADALRSVTVGLDLLEDVVLASYVDPSQRFGAGIEVYFQAHPVEKPANQASLLAYLLGETPGRRTFEMLYALRDMKRSEAEVGSIFDAFAAKPFAVTNGRVFVGFLDLANGAGASRALVEKIVAPQEFTNLSNDENVRAFYDALKLPQIHAAVAASPSIQKTVCAINGRLSSNLGLDRYGDSVLRSVPLKTCAELIAGK